MIHLLHTKNRSIYDQLRLEEALLRTDNRNWCIINEGSPPAIVMGVSGKPEELIHLDKADIPIIKRFSGGGTVVVDDKTLFVSWILQKDFMPVKPYPEPILAWSADIYKKALQIPEFSLIENDYAIGRTKCAGNAQYLTKNRWVHHTTFLWDYEPKMMSLLKLPKSQPKYRKGRDHGEFITRLRPHYPSINALASAFIAQITSEFPVTKAGTSIYSKEFPSHRTATCFIKNPSKGSRPSNQPWITWVRNLGASNYKIIFAASKRRGPLIMGIVDRN